MEDEHIYLVTGLALARALSDDVEWVTSDDYVDADGVLVLTVANEVVSRCVERYLGGEDAVMRSVMDTAEKLLAGDAFQVAVAETFLLEGLIAAMEAGGADPEDLRAFALGSRTKAAIDLLLA
jgi:hypothetical protein